jgi:hypothetical protein
MRASSSKGKLKMAAILLAFELSGWSTLEFELAGRFTPDLELNGWSTPDLVLSGWSSSDLELSVKFSSNLSSLVVALLHNARGEPWCGVSSCVRSPRVDGK